jgi:hypothetical protein
MSKYIKEIEICKPAIEAPRTPADRIVQVYFHDPSRPPGHRFLGAALVSIPRTGPWRDADTIRAVLATWRLNINPGGAAVVIEHDEQDRVRLEPQLNRLLAEREALQLGLFTSCVFGDLDRKRIGFTRDRELYWRD